MLVVFLTTSAFERSRWRGRRCACDTPEIMGCDNVLNRFSPFSANSIAFNLIAGESRFNSHSLTASAANASGFLQTALSKLPRWRGTRNERQSTASQYVVTGC